MNIKIQILCTFLFQFLLKVNTENILFVLPIATKSHQNIFSPLVHELASRGHKITLLSPFPSSGLPKNVKEIFPVLRETFKDDFKMNPLEMRAKGDKSNVFFFGTEFGVKCNEGYQHPELQKLIKEGHFDLVFMNGYFNQCFWGLIAHFKSPSIILTTMASPLFLTRFTGNYHPLSFVPAQFLWLSDQMNFVERTWNFIASYLATFLNDKNNGLNEEIYRKYLGNDLPSLTEIGYNVSLIMSNEHFVLNYPRSNLPDTISIGGIHCRPAKPLNKELEDFVSAAAEHGFIYFSLGSIIQPEHLSEETKKMFIDVFSRLKQRVLWKWDDENMTVPSNVLIKKWLPQQDILGHPNIKLFFTHGGLLSTTEAIYNGIPVLGMPVFVDQDLNMIRAENLGFGLKLEILGLKEKILESTLHRLLNEPNFAETAKKLSIIFRDQLESPLDRAVYWTEYVLRHKGAQHLRSAARELNFAQLHSLDVIGFILSLVGCVLAILYFLCAAVLRKFVNLIQRKNKTKSE